MEKVIKRRFNVTIKRGSFPYMLRYIPIIKIIEKYYKIFSSCLSQTITETQNNCVILLTNFISSGLY